MMISLLPTTVFASNEVITSANITITKPVGGESPSYADPISSDNGKYWAEVEGWYKMGGVGTLPVGAGGQFETQVMLIYAKHLAVSTITTIYNHIQNLIGKKTQVFILKPVPYAATL